MIRLLLVLLLLATPAHAGLVIGSGGYTDIILWEDFTDAADPYSITSSNCNTGTATAWTLSSLGAINATAKLTGDYGVQCPGGLDYATLAIASGDFFNSTKGAIVIAFYQVDDADDDPDVAAGIFSAEGTTDLEIRVAGATDELAVVWGAETTITTSDANFAANTWYWVVYVYDATANTQEVHIYTNASPPVEMGTGASSAAAITPLDTIDSIRAGEHAGAGDEGEMWVDHLVIFDGSITRTAAEYLAIAKDNATCPL